MKTFEPCEERKDGCIDGYLLSNHTKLTESGYWEITPLMAECLDQCDKFNDWRTKGRLYGVTVKLV